MKALLIAGILFSLNLFANPNTPVGIWTVAAQDAKIEIYLQGDELEGKIAWLKEPNDKSGQPKLDVKNPDETKRSRPIMGMTLLTGFKKNKDEWGGGEIYDAKSGKTYKANIKLDGETKLKLRGYVGIPLFGRTEEWTK